MTNEDVTQFTEVDRTGDPDFFVRFLDQGNAIPDIQKSKSIILDGLPDQATALQALILDYLALGNRTDAAALLPRLLKVDAGLGKQMQLIVTNMGH